MEKVNLLTINELFNYDSVTNNDSLEYTKAVLELMQLSKNTRNRLKAKMFSNFFTSHPLYCNYTINKKKTTETGKGLVVGITTDKKRLIIDPENKTKDYPVVNVSGYSGGNLIKIPVQDCFGWRNTFSDLPQGMLF